MTESPAGTTVGAARPGGPTSTAPTPLATVPRSLAHPSTDPRSLVARVQTALGWQGSDFLVGLQGYDELMATLETAHDLEGLFRIGDPASPHLRLLRALHASSSGLKVTRVTRVPSPWRWVRVGEGQAVLSGVALRQQTYLDVLDSLGRAGVTFRVLPDETTTDELLEVGEALGSAVVDLDEVVDESLVVPGYLDDAPDLVYGLVSREDPSAGDVVWLAMSPESDATGTLMVALEQFSALDTNLVFLHSDPRGETPEEGHDFYVGFHAEHGRVAELHARLGAVGFASRVLASFARQG